MNKEMSAEEKDRLVKLNAYLAAKGRQPKQFGTVNFVKHNIGLVSREKKSDCVDKAYKTIAKENSNVRMGLSAVTKTPKLPLKERYSLKNGAENTNTSLSNRRKISHKVVSKTPTLHSSYRNMTPASVVLKGGDGVIPHSTSKISMRSYSPRTPAHRPDTSLRKNLLKRRQGSVGKTPKSTAVQQRKALIEKLNRWLVAKGKRPKTVGFKPTKIITTPVGSPVPSATAERTGWRGMRDADDSDELSALIGNVMDDIQDCMDEGCPPAELRSNLLELAEGLNGVKQHARYWVALARVERATGTSHQKICDLFAEAVNANARPIETIQEAINDLAMQNFDKESTPLVLSHCIDQNTHLNCSAVISDCHETPLLKNMATSPINFQSPTASHAETCFGTPSSVVKLRIISRSAQIFDKVRYRRALPDETRAIVTPVRRSMRIASSHLNYPRGLREHEPCLNTVEDILPALQRETPGQTACGIIFDPNVALGDDFSDISKVIKF